MKNIIFTIFVNIPDNEIDNPASYDKDGVLGRTDKSVVVKRRLLQYKDRLIESQQKYADTIGADYKVFTWDDQYDDFLKIFKTKYPQISHYDVINFYKHFLMASLASQYENVCYFDLDIVPNTTESIFEAFDIANKFAVPDSNEEAKWGKRVNPAEYNCCIRNPATKYWNAHAMLSEKDLPPNQNVYNTGIMVSSSNIIKQLGYFETFEEDLKLMSDVKFDKFSLYPVNIQRVFNYDNETLFSYKITSNNVSVDLMDLDWHYPLRFDSPLPQSKMYHVIDKIFARFYQ